MTDSLFDPQTLLLWFKDNSAPYPWRQAPTPYWVWISEVMLQQTQAAAVIPYFLTWIKRFPDAAALARASEQQLLGQWEGLGYYSRVRNIHKTAKILVSRFNNQLPSDFETLNNLPGIGEYTASAILSIGFKKPYPVLDANVRRIIQRLKGWETWNPRIQKHAKILLARMLPEHNPGLFNEALMQFGQSLCLPRNPSCHSCPFNHLCGAYGQGTQHSIPERKKRETIVKQSYVLIYRYRDRVLLIKRKAGIGKGLWSFPLLPKGKESPWFKEISNTASKTTHQLKTRHHFYTRYKEALFPLILEVHDQSAVPGYSGKWVPIKELDNYPCPSVYRQIFQEVKAKGSGPA